MHGETSMKIGSRIVPCLWFDSEAEEAARFYVSVFPNSRVARVARYGEAGREIHGREAGSVMVVEFELDGQPFMALNGGPMFRFNEAISLKISCDTQEEIDHYWDALTAGGDARAQQCGWLKDRYGLSWQVVPSIIGDLLADHASPGAARVMDAIHAMQKLDLAALLKAHAG